MKQHRHEIGRQLHVEFDRLGSRFEGRGKTGQSVFGIVGLIAAMRNENGFFYIHILFSNLLRLRVPAANIA